MTDLQRIRQMARRYCGFGIVVKPPIFDEPWYVVQRKATEEEGTNTEVAQIPSEWASDGEWDRIEEAIHNACK